MGQRFISRTFVWLAISLVTQPVFAIIRRADVPDAKYLALGQKYGGVLVALAVPSRSDGAPLLDKGMGTLVAKDWVITAAHVASDLLKPGTHDLLDENHFVFHKARGYRIAKIYVHPDWDASKNLNDIALIQLAREVKQPTPVCIYKNSDEKGKLVTLVGQGLPGTGASGRGNDDGALRAATVRVGTAIGSVLTWIFHKPTDPLVTPMEGISGPGDSGGPALLSVNGELCIVGVSSYQAYAVDIGEGHYGVKETYMRVSAFHDWIEKTITDAGLKSSTEMQSGTN